MSPEVVLRADGKRKSEYDLRYGREKTECGEPFRGRDRTNDRARSPRRPFGSLGSYRRRNIIATVATKESTNVTLDALAIDC